MVPEQLQAFFKAHPKLALGFSGGVDSSYLLYAARLCGVDIQPYFVQSQFQPAFELEDAKRLTQMLDTSLKVIELDLRSHPEVLHNPADRCYHCKRIIFEAIKEQALADGYSVIIDGNNASDDAADRPGMNAVAELQVLSPLRESGLTKSKIRELSREADLFTWNKPAYACLATPIPTGHEIIPELLIQVEKAEDILFELGFYDYRVRVLGEYARIELLADQMPKAMEYRDTIVEELSKYFTGVLLDLKARPNHE